jgi:nitroreductase
MLLVTHYPLFLMNVIEAIRTRRAVKKFDPHHVMSEEEIHQLLLLAMEAPTAFNIQNWRFLLVQNPEVRKQIRAAAWDQEQITDSSLLIVMCADLSSWKDRPERYWANATQAARSFILPAIHDYYDGKPQVIRDEAMRSCGLAGQTIMLAAKAMGLDSNPMDGFDFDAVGKIIHLPEDHLISFMIAVGKKVQEPHPKPGQLSYDEIVKIDRF